MYPSFAFKQKSLALLLLAFGIYCPVVPANGLSFSTAADFTTGKYGGTTSTDIWYVPFTARYDKDRASFRLIVPYLSITGPGNVLGPGIGGIVDGGGPIIGGGLGGSSSGSGGVVVVCDEDAQNCSGENPGREEIDSGSGNSGSGGNGSGDDDGNSGSGGNGGGNDDDNSGSGGNGGGDDDDNSGSGGGGGGNDDDNSGSGGNGGRNDDDNSGSGGNGGGNDDDNSGSGSDDEDDDSSDAINSVRLSKTSSSGLIAGIPLGGSSFNSTTQSGLGDIVAAFSYNLIDHARTGIIFDITTRLKIPTASAKQNMGSGQVDYAIQGDLFKSISKFTLSATFGYRILGNPSGIIFHNVLYGAAGVGYQLSSTVTMGTSYTMGQSPVRLEDSRDLMLWACRKIQKKLTKGKSLAM
ncbi:MAG: hypothetical protein ABTQ25_11630, partial [Nitrosomonas ureae]